ncbi:MAG: polysaccharide deacetylase family protein [Dysgonamonadaceae bacterium]|jgi:hypothetical protein|nr:polysaccharide deacetylase family protein [Dysgonamonadaceae bacterium]
MIHIFSSPENASRLHYVARHLFNEVLGTEFTLVPDKNRFLQQSGICINYSNEPLNHGLQIVPHGLLAEKGVRIINDLQESEWKGLFCFFKQTGGDIPFDVFSAAFYLLTLYEEYIPKRLDQHDRFHHEDALSYRKGFLETPIVDRWAYLLKDKLEEKGYEVSSFQLRKYQVINTFDIDHPYLYLNKGLIRNATGAARDLLHGNLKQILHRILVLLHLRPDPFFQAIRRIDAIQKQYGRSYYLFVLVAGKTPYDRKVVYPQRRFYNYLRQLQSVAVGLHPSYLTLRDLNRLMNEKSKLEHILRRKVTLNRQHFLRMQNPETFQELNLAGFQEDFTPAFAHAPGFRSGTAVPHFFYDVERETETGLLVHPSIVMDSTFIFHHHLSPEEALQKMKDLIDACKKSGGDYLSIWHNSNLAGTDNENPWRNIFIQSFEYALSLEND